MNKIILFFAFSIGFLSALAQPLNSKQIDSLEDPVRLSDALCSVQAGSKPAAITCVLLLQAW